MSRPLSGWKDEAHDRVIAGVDHYFVSEVPDVLNWIAHSGLSVEDGSREFYREFTLLNIFGERRVADVSS